MVLSLSFLGVIVLLGSSVVIFVVVLVQSCLSGDCLYFAFNVIYCVIYVCVFFSSDCYVAISFVVDRDFVLFLHPLHISSLSANDVWHHINRGIILLCSWCMLIITVFVCLRLVSFLGSFFVFASFFFVVFPMLGVFSGNMLGGQVDVLSYEVRCQSR